MKKGFIAEGTVCNSCSKVIKKQAMKVDGVSHVEFDYTTESGHVTYDSKKTNIDHILDKIEEKGYTCYIADETKKKSSIGLIIGIAGILIVGFFLFSFVEGISMPAISQNMSYGLLFVVGLLTGFHCISMCGGFVISYTTNSAKKGESSHKSHLAYGTGKLISYTVIGALFGLLGSIIAFTPTMRAIAGIVAGLFLVIFGLNMLNVIPGLRKIRFHTPKFLTRFIGEKSARQSSPLIIGLLNGLMIACGPLQAIYIMAAGTGSMVEGAKLLFIFALGTLPVMIGFGYFASYISSKMTNQILKASGAIVIFLGLVMINNALTLSGTGYDINSMLAKMTVNELDQEGSNNVLELTGGYQEIRMDVTQSGWTPNKFVLEKGVPVRWIINGIEITGCNNAIQVPKYGLNFDIKQGEQIIEFTPTEEGIVSWSCWMGMIPGTFIVKDNIKEVDVAKELETVQLPKGGSCGMSTGGGCGCGGK